MARFVKYQILTILAAISIMGVARAGILFDQPPSQGFAAGSDTEFYDLWGSDPQQHVFQRVADNISFSSSETIRRVIWWGCYGGDGYSTFPPPGDELTRIRIYQPRPTDGLPGNVLYEQTILNVGRVATGRVVYVPGGPAEYRFEVDLATLFVTAPGAAYWLEIAQVGDVDSLYRWSLATNNPDGAASINTYFPDWVPNSGISFGLQLSDIPEPNAIALFSSMALMAIRVRKERR